MSEIAVVGVRAWLLGVLLPCTVIVPSQLLAQTVTLKAVLSNASYALPGTPNEAIAQGSIFALFGSNLAPDGTWQASQFPIRPSTPFGTSVKVVVGGKSFDALPIYTTPLQVGAILPSDCPVGDGAVVLTYNGQSSAPVPIRVVRSNFGAFAVNQRGSGPAVAQNFQSESDVPLNSLDRPARPGQAVTLWGTGLGPIAAPDAGPPPVGDLPVDVAVWVGGLRAKVLYKGRSGCCSGIDQITFSVPEGIEGCYVPVVVEADGIASNFTSISVAGSGKSCTIVPLSLDGLPINSSGSLRYGLLAFWRSTSHELPQDSTTLAIEGIFARFDSLTSSASGMPPAGSCTVTVVSASSGNPSYPSVPSPLDAGRLTVSGPMNGVIPNEPGHYYEMGYVRTPGFPPGTYTLDNGTGGKDVKAFRASLVIDEPLAWTNHADFEGTVSRAQGLRVTWTTPATDGVVAISGRSAITSPAPGVVSQFVCMAPVSAGEFTVPPVVLRGLPASKDFGYLSVERGVTLTFQAEGLDLGQLVYDERAWTDNVRYQ